MYVQVVMVAEKFVKMFCLLWGIFIIVLFADIMGMVNIIKDRVICVEEKAVIVAEIGRES